MVQSPSLVNVPWAVRKGLLWWVNLASCGVWAQGVFPNRETSAELRVGLNSGSVGGRLRAEWGQHGAAELELHRALDLSFGQNRTRPQESWTVRLPLRLPIDDQNFWAPTLAYRFAAGRGSVTAGFEFQTQWGLWVLRGDAWMLLGGLSGGPSGDPATGGGWSTQLQYEMAGEATARAFWGLRYARENINGGAAEGVALVTGARF